MNKNKCLWNQFYVRKWRNANRMDLTEKEYENFISKKSSMKNVFDVLVLLYSYIDDGKKRKYRSKYFKFLSQNPEYWKDIELLNNELLEEVISFSTFIDRLWKLFSRENVRYYAFKLLFSYEHYMTEGYKILNQPIPQDLHHKISILGPMNTVVEKYSLYIMPHDHFFKDYNSSRPKEAQIRLMEQSEFNRIDERIKSYKIIKTDKLNENVKVIEYNSSRYVLPQKLKIALVPMSSCKWFKEIQIPNENENFAIDNETEETLDIVDVVIADDEKNVDCINNAYIRILEKCMEENIQIVVFPELARNKKTLENIKSFLSQHMILRENSLELIFLGSFSENARNEGILLNGSGTELLRVLKKNAYKKIKNDVLYREQLIDICEEITLIDIPRLGRIQYSICKDGLNTVSQNDLWAIFEISFSVISAYSESLSHFTNLGSSFSTQYGGIQIVANACASRMEKVEVNDKQVLELGNVIIPCARGNDMSVDKLVQKYETMKYCWDKCKKNVEIGSCIRVINIYPCEVSENDVLNMSLDNIIL